ncbi:MAG: arginine repressor [Alistipes sp.]
MGKKNERIGIIKRIINDELISSQDELIRHLEVHGVKATQSTLSRDFKAINVLKTPHPEKGYVYVLGDSIVGDNMTGSVNLDDAIIDIKFSGNIGVISTKPGYASAISVIVDSRKSKDILGTVAGDNAIIMILREGVSHQDVAESFKKIFPTLKYAAD